MDNKRLTYLLQQYAATALTPAEAAELFQLIDEQNEEAATQEVEALITAQSSDGVAVEGSLLASSIEKIMAVDRPIDERHAVVRQMRIRRSWLWTAAAVLLITLSAGAFLISQKSKKLQAEALPGFQKKTGITPGGDRAVLTLADGTKIILDQAANGNLSEQGGVKVIKKGGQVTYSAGNKQAQVLYNTIVTPRGGQYHLLLSDGTKVWLNAASSLRFPTAFNGKERRVELTGEGYFEVAHNDAMAFHVKVNDLDVQVLGTQFNINSYSDEEAIRTTLLQGKVNVRKGDEEMTLLPGQQVKINTGGGLKLEKNADVEAAVAWKNGLFQFSGADVKTIARQIARWYDIDVTFTGNMQSAHLSGEVPRSFNLAQVLAVLETSGIEVKAVGRTLTLTPRS